MKQQALNTVPLISNSFLTKLTVATSVVALLTIGVSIAGKWYGRSIASGQHTESTAPKDIFIGPDHLRLPENVIRSPEQRVSGEAEQVNVALQWPAMLGYSAQNAAAFIDSSSATSLIFITYSQSTMTRDMSGRVAPIYSRLFEGLAEPGPNGLTLHHFRKGSGYGDEVLLTDPNGGQTPFAVRCVLPASPLDATSADCQRDIHLGQDLNVEYRFSSTLLSSWKTLDADVSTFTNSHFVR
jgi:hypothetical protein